MKKLQVTTAEMLIGFLTGQYLKATSPCHKGYLIMEFGRLVWWGNDNLGNPYVVDRADESTIWEVVTQD